MDIGKEVKEVEFEPVEPLEHDGDQPTPDPVPVPVEEPVGV